MCSLSAGVIFFIRLVGSTFSFYSVDPSFKFLQLFEDYSNLGDAQDPPLTVVHQCEFTYPDEGLFAGKSIDDRTFTEFDFVLPEHRNIIIRMLESIRLQIIRSNVAMNSHE